MATLITVRNCHCFRSAAKCNKGIDVLYCAAVEHFIHVAVKVKRGADRADRSLSCVRDVVVCTQCQESAVCNYDVVCQNGQHMHDCTVLFFLLIALVLFYLFSHFLCSLHS